MAVASALPVAVDLKVGIGGYTTLDFVFQGLDGAPIDLTGDTVVLTVRASFGTVILFQITNTVHVDPTAGRTQFVVSEADLTLSGAVPDRIQSWMYEVRRYVTTGSPVMDYVWFQGAFEVHPTVGG